MGFMDELRKLTQPYDDDNDFFECDNELEIVEVNDELEEAPEEEPAAEEAPKKKAAKKAAKKAK